MYYYIQTVKWKLKLQTTYFSTLSNYKIIINILYIYISQCQSKRRRHFVEIEKLMLQCTLKCQNPSITNVSLKKI